jgi:hypothetical protein
MTEFETADLLTLNKLFVFGSMSTGRVHFQKISAFVTESRPGSIQAYMYKLKVGLPVAVWPTENDLGQIVTGELLSLKPDTEMLFNLLDSFHSVNRMDENKSLFLRKKIPVQVETNQFEWAWCYFMNPGHLPAGSARIDGTQWSQMMNEEKSLIETLSDRQKTYILKLGKASGRETVPINDLTLYRELMNLELIVDKGRRLALSKLGNEVFRYLN